MLNPNSKKTTPQIGMALKAIRMSIKDQNTLNEVIKFFSGQLTEPATIGRGVMQYTGEKSADGAIFLGTSTKLGLTGLMFFGTAGAIALDNFRGNFIDLTINEHHVANMNVTSIESVHVQYRLGFTSSISDFVSSVSNSVTCQQKTTPKVSLQENTLYIGGKAGASYVSIKPVVNADLTVSHIVSVQKMKEKSCNIFCETLKNSIKSSTTSVLAACMVNQLNRATQSPLISGISKQITRNNDLGKVIMSQQSLSRSTTKSGKFVMRVLSGLKTKLYLEQSSLETTDIFLGWLTTLFTPPVKLKNLSIIDTAGFIATTKLIVNHADWELGMKNTKPKPNPANSITTVASTSSP